MDEEKLEKKLKEIKWDEVDNEIVDAHREKFEQSLLMYVEEENRKQVTKRKMRLSFAFALVGILVFTLLVSISRFTQGGTFEELIMKNPTELKMYNDIKALLPPNSPPLKIKINKIEEDKNLGITNLYVNLKNSIVIIDSKQRNIIGVGFPLYHAEQSAYRSQIINLTEREIEEAREITLSNSFIKRLSVKSIEVENPTVFVDSYEDNLPYRVGKVKVVTVNGKVITVFVDLTRNRVLDITDTQNVLGEYITRDPEIHNFFYDLGV